MSATMSREIRLKCRPVGLPRASDFEVATVSMPTPGAGEVLVRNLYMSVDPYMRGRMLDQPSYVQPFQVGQPLDGGCVGQVIQSQGGKFQVGDHVLGRKGWREYYVSDGADLTRVDPNLAPVQTYLGTLGMPGLTAYVGLLDIGRPQAGETVFVSAAAGAVGTVVCQIAKLQGCRVVGSAGTPPELLLGSSRARTSARCWYASKALAGLCLAGDEEGFGEIKIRFLALKAWMQTFP